MVETVVEISICFHENSVIIYATLMKINKSKQQAPSLQTWETALTSRVILQILSDAKTKCGRYKSIVSEQRWYLRYK